MLMMKKLTSEEDNKTPQLLDKIGTETLLALLTCHTKTDASIQLGIDRKTLYLRMEKYGLREYINRLPEQALESLKMGSVKAVENYVHKIDHRDASISLEASNQILDRIGLGSKQQQASVQNNIVIVPSGVINRYGDTGTTLGTTEDSRL